MQKNATVLPLSSAPLSGPAAEEPPHGSAAEAGRRLAKTTASPPAAFQAFNEVPMELKSKAFETADLLEANPTASGQQIDGHIRALAEEQFPEVVNSPKAQPRSGVLRAPGK